MKRWSDIVVTNWIGNGYQVDLESLKFAVYILHLPRTFVLRTMKMVHIKKSSIPDYHKIVICAIEILLNADAFNEIDCYSLSLWEKRKRISAVQCRFYFQLFGRFDCSWKLTWLKYCHSTGNASRICVLILFYYMPAFHAFSITKLHVRPHPQCPATAA